MKRFERRNQTEIKMEIAYFLNISEEGGGDRGLGEWELGIVSSQWRDGEVGGFADLLLRITRQQTRDMIDLAGNLGLIGFESN